MKTLFCACGLLLAAQVQAQQASDWFGGFVLADSEHTGFNYTPLNQENFTGIAGSRNALVGLLEGSYQQLSWRARLEAQRTHAPTPDNGARLRLLELNRVFQLSEGSTLSLGKRLYSLDPAYVNQPLGFFQKRTELSDPLDALGQAEGVPMAVLSWVGAKASVNALYARDYQNAYDGFNQGVTQSILRASYEFAQASVSALVRRASGETDGTGATFSAGVGAAWSYYGSYYSARGSQRPILNFLFDEASAQDIQQGMYRSHDGRRYHRLSAGLVYTPPHWPKLQLEWSYDGRGLSAAQYARFLEQIRLNQAAARPDFVIKARQAVLAQSLLTQGLRKRYLSLSLSQTLADWELSGGAYAGLEDHGLVWHAQAEYKFATDCSLLLALMRQHGAADSERSLAPIAHTAALRLRWQF